MVKSLENQSQTIANRLRNEYHGQPWLAIVTMVKRMVNQGHI